MRKRSQPFRRGPRDPQDQPSGDEGEDQQADAGVDRMQRQIERVRRASEWAVGMGAEDRGACEILFDDEQHDRPMQYNLRGSVSPTLGRPIAF